MNPHTADIITALDKLATEGTPEQIAVRLEIDGCAGYRRSFIECPIAEWLLLTTGKHVTIGPGWWSYPALPPFDVDYDWGELPDPIAEFVDGFDHDGFPRIDVDAPR